MTRHALTMGVVVEKHSLLTDESIEAWITENDPGGLQKLIEAVVLGRLTGARRRYVDAYLDRKREASSAEAKNLEHDLQMRNVRAAESSAVSARDSVKWAKTAAVMAGLALLMSVVVAVAQFMLPSAPRADQPPPAAPTPAQR